MKRNHLKSLTNNIGYKLLAVALAFIFWLVVYNIDDPVKTKSFTTAVVIENEHVISDMGKYFEVLDGSNQVTFTVSAKRSVLDKLDDSYFTASADMGTMTTDATGSVGTVELKITSSKYENSLKYNSKSKYLRVALEELMSKQFVIVANTNGEVAEGFALGDVTIEGSNVLKVSGPASIVETIESAVATINVDGVSTTVSDKVIPTLYTADGLAIDTTKLTMNIQTVGVEASVLGTKELPIILASTGKPMDDYAVIEITASPSTILVKGSSRALNSVTKINVPAEVIDVSGLSASIQTTVDITQYLPDGITLVDAASAIIDVDVDIEKYEARIYNIAASRIQIEGLAENEEISFEDATIAVTIGGTTDALDKLTASNITLILDASGLSKGEHNVELRLADSMTLYTLVNGKTKVIISDVGSAGMDSVIGAGAGDGKPASGNGTGSGSNASGNTSGSNTSGSTGAGTSGSSDNTGNAGTSGDNAGSNTGSTSGNGGTSSESGSGDKTTTGNN